MNLRILLTIIELIKTEENLDFSRKWKLKKKITKPSLNPPRSLNNDLVATRSNSTRHRPGVGVLGVEEFRIGRLEPLNSLPLVSFAHEKVPVCALPLSPRFSLFPLFAVGYDAFSDLGGKLPRNFRHSLRFYGRHAEGPLKGNVRRFDERSAMAV